MPPGFEDVFGSVCAVLVRILGGLGRAGAFGTRRGYDAVSDMALPDNLTFSGAVLAGGRSSRFGQDKALYVHEGKPLAVRALASFARADERFVVSSRPYAFGVPCYPDRYPGSSLGGLHAALLHAAHDWVAVAACDMPFLTPDYWEKLLAHTQGVQAVVVQGPSGRLEPLAALYHKTLLPLAEGRLKAGDFKLSGLLEATEVRVLAFGALGLDPDVFVNLNRLEDVP